MMTKTWLILRTAFGHYIVKILTGITLSILLVTALIYLKIAFFPDFSFLMTAHCIDANDMALTTITSNPIEMYMPLNNQIEEFSSDLNDTQKTFQETLFKEKKMMCMGFMTHSIAFFALAVTLTSCFYLTGVTKFC